MFSHPTTKAGVQTGADTPMVTYDGGRGWAGHIMQLYYPSNLISTTIMELWYQGCSFGLSDFYRWIIRIDHRPSIIVLLMTGGGEHGPDPKSVHNLFN